jgi:hypothetical protein
MSETEREVLVGDVLEVEEKPTKITGRKPQGEIKQAAMVILEENGFGHGAIAKALDYHPKSVSRALPALREKSLQHPRMVALARKTVKKVMEGYHGRREKQADGKLSEPVTDPRVKASDAMRAAELVYSRAEPVKQEQQGGSSQTFIQVNQAFFGGPEVPNK